MWGKVVMILPVNSAKQSLQSARLPLPTDQRLRKYLGNSHIYIRNSHTVVPWTVEVAAGKLNGREGAKKVKVC